MTDSFLGGDNNRQSEAPNQTNHWSQLRRKFVRDALLSLSADGGFCRIRMGLDHRTQEIWSQLLLWRVSLRLPAEISAHAYRAAGQSCRDGRSLLCPTQDVAHLHALFRQWIQHHLRTFTRNGSRPMRLFVDDYFVDYFTCPGLISSISFSFLPCIFFHIFVIHIFLYLSSFLRVSGWVRGGEGADQRNERKCSRALFFYQFDCKLDYLLFFFCCCLFLFLFCCLFAPVFVFLFGWYFFESSVVVCRHHLREPTKAEKLTLLFCQKWISCWKKIFKKPKPKPNKEKDTLFDAFMMAWYLTCPFKCLCLCARSCWRLRSILYEEERTYYDRSYYDEECHSQNLPIRQWVWFIPRVSSNSNSKNVSALLSWEFDFSGSSIWRVSVPMLTAGSRNEPSNQKWHVETFFFTTEFSRRRGGCFLATRLEFVFDFYSYYFVLLYYVIRFFFIVFFSFLFVFGFVVVRRM